ncbi:MAG: hypothetical protein NVS3B7_19580 [Candidatus Elarobacter sp.]
MRPFRHSPVRLTRALFTAASLLALAACGGGGASSGAVPPPNNYGVCDPGTQVTLANPLSGQTNVPTGTTRIEIVANGNNNTLYRSYGSFDLVLVDSFNTRITSAPLALVSDPNGIKPYPSDYYYTGTIPGNLNFGTNYSVYLNIFNSQCQQLPFVGSFST